MKRFEPALEIAKEHQELDRFLAGKWLHKEKVGDYFKGCMFGCMTQTNSEKSIEIFCKEYDMPAWLGYLCEKIFENLEEKYSLTFPLDILTKLAELPEDFNFEIVEHKISVKRLRSLVNDGFSSEVNDSIKSVIKLHEKTIDGQSVNTYHWSAAESAAASAARSSAESAAASAATSAAWSAVWSAAESAAESAAASAARSSAESAAWSAAWKQERDNLLEALTVN